MSKYLEEKKNDLITRAEEILNKAKEEQRELTDAEATEIAGIKADIENIKRSIGLDEDIKNLTEAEKKRDNTPEEDRNMGAEEKRELEQRAIEEAEAKNFECYIRGQVNERAGELTPATSSAGYVIPTTIAKKIIDKVYDISPVLEKSEKYNVKGNIDIPVYDDSSNDITVAYATEFTALSSSSGAFAKVSLTGFLAGALTKVSRTLINKSEFDIVGFVIDKMATNIARFIEKELLVGTPSKVTGMSTLTNIVNTASASAITADEIITVHDAVKQAYQKEAIWVVNSATLTALRKLKDSTGAYILNDDFTNEFGYSMLGKPVYVSDSMPVIATKTTVLYYGDFRGLATKMNEDINIEVLREKYADEHAIGVIGWVEFDGKVANAQALAGLKMA